MFTGIIQSLGQISRIDQKGTDSRFHINTGDLAMDAVEQGDSIAVNGVCLTAINPHSKGFEADVSGETLSKSTLGELKAGSPVNLEKALTLSTPLGGHLVSGHVDGVGTVVKRANDGRSVRFDIEAPAILAKYIAQKGSITVDGISLTVNKVDGAVFELNIVPHTLDVTTIGQYETGQRVNLEVDLLARYLERLMLGDKAADKGNPGITENFLREHGFIG